MGHVTVCVHLFCSSILGRNCNQTFCVHSLHNTPPISNLDLIWFFFSPFLLVTKSLCMSPPPQQTSPRSYTSTAQCTVTCEWLSLSWLGSPVKTWLITFLQSSDLWLLFITSAPQEELMFHFFDREDKVHVKGVINCNYTGKKLEKALLPNDKKVLSVYQTVI